MGLLTTPIGIAGAAGLTGTAGGSLNGLPTAPLAAADHALLEDMRSRRSLARLDVAALMAVHCARGAATQAGWPHLQHTGINIGSARGATTTLERYHTHFLAEGSVPPLTSPHTTAGHLAAIVAQELEADGPAFAHSITCSSAAFALANAVAWLQAGLVQRFLAGGTEAPLTPFILAQMQALGIYVPSATDCRPLMPDTRGMYLGEAAAVFALEKNPGKPLGWITALGFGNEKVPSPTGITPGGDCLYHSMTQALEGYPHPIDLVMAHAPGTPAGDSAELQALHRVFGGDLPPLYSTKWCTGHSFGASAGTGLLWVLQLLAGQPLPQPPYAATPMPASPRHILLNSVGFGGNAVTLILSAP